MQLLPHNILQSDPTFSFLASPMHNAANLSSIPQIGARACLHCKKDLLLIHIGCGDKAGTGQQDVSILRQISSTSVTVHCFIAISAVPETPRNEILFTPGEFSGHASNTDRL